MLSPHTNNTVFINCERLRVRLQKKNFFKGVRIFEAIFNYSIISPPLVLKPQSVEIGGAYFRVSTVI